MNTTGLIILIITIFLLVIFFWIRKDYKNKKTNRQIVELLENTLNSGEKLDNRDQIANFIKEAKKALDDTKRYIYTEGGRVIEIDYTSNPPIATPILEGKFYQDYLDGFRKEPDENTTKINDMKD